MSIITIDIQGLEGIQEVMTVTIKYPQCNDSKDIHTETNCNTTAIGAQREKKQTKKSIKSKALRGHHTWSALRPIVDRVHLENE